MVNRWKDEITDEQGRALWDLVELEDNPFFDTAWKVEQIIRIMRENDGK